MSRALAERDRGCVWPGCNRPPHWTQAHHARRPWALGGETNIEDLALVCLPHHGLLRRGWRLERSPGGRVVVHAPGHAGPVYGPAVHDPPPVFA